MKRCVAFALMIGVLVAADDPRKDVAKEDFPLQANDKEKIQGTWALVALESGGQQIPVEVIKDFKIVFKGNNISFILPGLNADQGGTFKLDPTKSPKWMDVTHAQGDQKGQTAPGIYTLNGNELKLCAGGPTDKRPTEFVSKAGSMVGVMVLKREKR